MAMPSGADPKDSAKTREAAKRLLDQLQRVDMDKVDILDLQITMSGDEDELTSLVEALEGEGSEESVADSNVATLDSEKDEEEDKS